MNLFKMFKKSKRVELYYTLLDLPKGYHLEQNGVGEYKWVDTTRTWFENDFRSSTDRQYDNFKSIHEAVKDAIKTEESIKWVASAYKWSKV